MTQFFVYVILMLQVLVKKMLAHIEKFVTEETQFGLLRNRQLKSIVASYLSSTAHLMQIDEPKVAFNLYFI